MFSQAAIPSSRTRVKAVSFRTVEDDRINVGLYVVQFNFSRDGNAGEPYSSIKLIGHWCRFWPKRPYGRLQILYYWWYGFLSQNRQRVLRLREEIMIERVYSLVGHHV